MEQRDREYLFVEKILSLLRLLQENGLDPYTVTDSQLLQLLRDPEEARRARSVCDTVAFTDEMPGGFFIYAADGDERVLYANSALLHIYGCENMEQFRALTGNSFRGMVHPDDREMVEKSIGAQVGASRYDLDYVEYRIRRRDGKVRWVEDYGHFVRNARARSFFYVFLVDATEKRDRIQTERAMLINESLEKEQRLQNLTERYDKERALIDQEYLRRLKVIEGLSINYETILYVDLDADQALPYRLSVRTRPVFEERFQIRPYTRMIQEYIDRWVFPEERETVRQLTSPSVMREKLSECPSYYLNYQVLVDGETQYLQLRIVRAGQPGQAVLGYRRVDEELQREMEQKQLLAQALNQANAAMESKNTFLSNMSHDMRTPLNAILGFNALARRYVYTNPEAALEYLERMESSSRQLLDLIEKVLELAQGQSRPAHAEERECSLCALTREVYEYLLPQAREKDIDFTLDTAAVRCPEVYGDAERIRQLLLYLVNNAVTYTKPGGHVGITLKQGDALPGGCAEYSIEVRDTGVGISEEFQKRLFEPFARERNTTLSGVHGVGLGLTIVKNLVDMMGGAIAVESELGKGSAFTVSLRLRMAGEGAGQAQRPAPPQTNAHGGRSLLLVEDNELNREIETELLEEAGFHIDTACDGKEAVEKVRAARPGQYDLILMDLQMPVMDGWQAAEAIRRLKDPALAGLPIVALSANVLEDDVRRSAACGMNAHLSKPMDVDALTEKIEELTGG